MIGAQRGSRLCDRGCQRFDGDSHRGNCHSCVGKGQAGAPPPLRDGAMAESIKRVDPPMPKKRPSWAHTIFDHEARSLRPLMIGATRKRPQSGTRINAWSAGRLSGGVTKITEV